MTENQNNQTTNKVSQSELEEKAQPAPEKEIIQIPSKESLKEVVDSVSANIELFNKIQETSLRLTRGNDWVIQDQVPYLMERGAQRIAIAWGISIPQEKMSVEMEWMEDEKGRYYVFVATGSAYSRKLGRTITDQGVCSQRDKFFAKVGKEYKPTSEIDVTNIRKKAITNLYNRLIKRCCGLINVTLEDLEKVGVKPQTRVSYKKGGGKAKEAPKEKPAQPSQKKTITKEDLDKRKELWKMAQELAGGNEEEANGIVQRASAFGDNKGATDISKLRSEKWINFTYKNVKDLYRKQFGDEALQGKLGGGR